MRSILLLIIFTLSCGFSHAKSPNGVYELIQEKVQYRVIERWDFREDGTVTSYRRLESYRESEIKFPAQEGTYYWKSAWFGKEIYLKVSREAEGDGLVAFTQDGDDLIGTGKFSERSERYIKKR